MLVWINYLRSFVLSKLFQIIFLKPSRKFPSNEAVWKHIIFHFPKEGWVQSLEKNCSLIWLNPGLVACYPGPGAEILLYSAKTDSLVELRIYRPREKERRVILYNTQWPHLRQPWYRNTDTWLWVETFDSGVNSCSLATLWNPAKKKIL